MLIALIVLLVIIILLVLVMLIISPGVPYPIVDQNGKTVAGSISEKISVPINGVIQGMFIQSKDPQNPVLLFLHGGPGLPEYFLTEQYPSGLENYFTVCWWDQRGAGLSFHNDIPAESMTLDQLVADTIEVTNYLKRRFNKEKIYLMGHSGGTFIGIKAAQKSPELFYAYIGMAQMVFQLKSETLAYDYMLERYRSMGNAQMVQKLEKAAPTLSGPLPAPYDAIRDEAMHALGVGTTRDMKSIVTGVFFPSLWSKQYTLGEKINFWRGKIYSSKMLRNTMFATDLSVEVTDLKLPMYFLHGIFDYTISYPLTKSYFEKIRAPKKEFFTFEQSAHSPVFEEPEKTIKILKEIIERDQVH